MSGWRRKALELFPERHETIIRAGSSEALFADLRAELGQLYQSDAPDPAVTDRIYALATWAFDPGQHAELRESVAFGLFCHLPTYGPRAQADLRERLSLAALGELDGLWAERLEEPIYRAMVGASASVPDVPQRTPSAMHEEAEGRDLGSAT